MILVTIMTVMREHNVRLERAFQLFEFLLQSGSLKWQETRFELPHDCLLLGASQQRFGARASFISPPPFRAKDHPVNVQIATFANPFQERTAAANLNIVRVRPKAQNVSSLGV
jgi:hypothetical protein